MELLSKNTDETRPILSLEKAQYKKPTFIHRIKQTFKNDLEFIIIKIAQLQYPSSLFPQTNKIDNTKYNWFNFLFLFLYYEFSEFSNLYYLLLTMSQFYPPFEVGFKISYVLPLLVIILFRAAEEIFQFIRIKKRDAVVNNQLYKVKNFKKQIYENKKAQDIKVGDLIKVQDNQVPADLIILKSNFLKRTESVFISTTQIDGETDLKVRKPLDLNLQEYQKYEFQINTILTSLEEFEGMVTTIDDYNKVIDKIPLLLQNTVWSGCKISNNEIIGLVIAVGKNTRLTKNSKNIKINKTTYVDNKVEFFSFCLFLMMFLISIMNSLYQGTLFISLTAFIVSTVRFIILLSFLIPISLKLFLIGARMAYSHQIQSDKEIPGVIAKNETIVDELGKIDIVLSDKTGTITKNEMIMENISMGDQSYEAQRFKQLLSSDIKHGSGEFLEFALALAICNNVYMEIGDNNKPIFNASSPDEIAMVQFVEQIGLQFLQRDDNKIVFKDFTNKIYEYKIIKNFPFESAKKKMGLIVSYQDKNETKYKFYIKGADSIIKEKINSQNDKYFLEEMTLQMAYQGLRTLCFACKDLTHQQIQQFLEQQKQNLLKGKKKRNDELENQLEQNCSYLGITGVKDLLQENMPQSISNFDQAMVKVWILTGDKLETAAHICQCIGLVNRKRTLEKIQGINNRELDYLIESKLKTSSLEQYQKVLLVDGAVLETAMQNNIRRFLRFCLSHKFVCFARCSPIQKYNIAKILKEDLKQIVLAVGDGGNDVGMIQKSNIGIGIYGKEGNQAALAADFTITEFQHLSKMIFFHGRRAFMGLSSISQFILHRGLIISWIQEIFSACFFMISLPVYNGFMMVTYSGLFTILPVFSVIYDYDVSWNKLQQYLRSYKESSQGMEIKYFLIWNLISLYQAVAIVVSGFLLFNNFFNNFVEITFTALILAETFNIVLLVPRCSKWLFWSIAITFLLYIFCVFVFPTQFSINNFSLFFFANVFKIFVISWLPVFIFQMIMKSLNKDLTDL